MKIKASGNALIGCVTRFMKKKNKRKTNLTQDTLKLKLIKFVSFRLNAI